MKGPRSWKNAILLTNGDSPFEPSSRPTPRVSAARVPSCGPGGGGAPPAGAVLFVGLPRRQRPATVGVLRPHRAARGRGSPNAGPTPGPIPPTAGGRGGPPGLSAGTREVPQRTRRRAGDDRAQPPGKRNPRLKPRDRRRSRGQRPAVAATAERRNDGGRRRPRRFRKLDHQPPRCGVRVNMTSTATPIDARGCQRTLHGPSWRKQLGLSLCRKSTRSTHRSGPTGSPRRPEDAALRHLCDYLMLAARQGMAAARAKFPLVAQAEELEQDPARREAAMIMVMGDIAAEEMGNRLAIPRPTIELWEASISMSATCGGPWLGLQLRSFGRSRRRAVRSWRRGSSWRTWLARRPRGP